MKVPIVHVKSLYRQLTIALVVLVTIVSVSVSLFNYLYTSRESEAIFENKVLTYSSSLRESLEWPLWNLDDELVGKIGAAFASNTDIASLTILDEQQRVVFKDIKPNGNQIKHVVAIDHEGKRIGSVEIGLSLHAYEEKNKVMLLTSLITAVLLIISVLAALRWLLERLLRKPFDALVIAIDSVADAKYQQMAMPDIYSEFSPIIARFKTMTEVVASRELSLRQANANLELEMSARKKADSERRTSARRLQTFYEFDLVGLTITSPEKGWLSVNNYLCKLLEYTEQEMFSMTWAQLTHPDDLAADVAQFNLLLAHKIDGYSLEKRFISRTGKVIPTLLVVRCVRKENGEIDYVLAMVQDITERKRFETELIKHREHLEELVAERTTALVIANRQLSETQFAMDKAGIGIHWIDDDGRFIYANEYASHLLGYTQEQMSAMSVSDVDPNFAGKDFKVQVQPLREKGTATFETAQRHKNGNIIPLEVTFYYQPGKEGSSGRYISFVTDIRQRKQVEQVLQQAKEDAEAANRAKSIFLANMSHELRTPLNAILGFSSLMHRDARLNPEQLANLDIINRSGAHLLTLINDVLEMAKIEAGRSQLDITSFDLGEMVRDVTDMMEIRAREKGLHLLLDQSSAFPRYIHGDEARLRQILINLVGNAIKFTLQGGVTLRLGSRQNAISHLVIEVEDSGLGISAEDQQQLFQPFVQLGKQAGDNQGTGLGLSITQQFVKLMGGSISVESTLGKGTLFRVDLPLSEVKDDAIIRSQELGKGEVVELAPGQPEYRILIVEDQLENQLLLAQLMQRIGLAVHVADNGEQGVELFKSWHPHLIWMDGRMPVMDGLEATKVIRELPGGKSVKIVAVTASAFMEQRAEMMEAGMDDFVRKPYRFNEIYECLAKQLNVEFVYDDEKPTGDEALVELTPPMLAVLPPALRSELVDALNSLDSELINTVILKVAPYDLSLHKTLMHLAERFDYPGILKALLNN